ncbi:MAG TPA: molybdopterin-guanine dinucleotide biosynthesis protein MobB [Nitrospirota bacterium]|jgi:hypothetical protein
MKIITVSGAFSGCGKTTFARSLLSCLKGYAAIKVTTTDLFCKVTDSPEEINVPGKDTALYKEAGAARVVWIQSPREELEDSLAYALDMVGDVPGVVVEGNSPLKHINPDRAFFVMGGKMEEIKPGAFAALEKADVVVVNAEGGPTPGLAAAIREKNPHAEIVSMSALLKSEEKIARLI